MSVTLLVGLLLAAPARSHVTVLAFSDYHSHALPFYSEGRPGQAGIARAIAFLAGARHDPTVVVLSGGDTMNQGSPTWSDEYRCLEWPWLDGLVDAMAVGNHDLDYGPEEFERCRASAAYPLLSANLDRPDGTPYLTMGGKPYLVKEVAGVRLGFFALAGLDVQRLIGQRLPTGLRWAEPLATAREVVRRLREEEKVAAVVFFGHQAREEDEQMAREVPGIDLILGTHSHHRSELTTIPGTSTRYLAPFQYLTYVSRVQLGFDSGRLADVSGELVRMDETRPEDPRIAAEVARLQRELVARRPERFTVLGRAAVELSDAGVSSGESVIGDWATEVLRRAADAHAFLSTSSSFRGGIPPGDVTAEAFYAAIPYSNTLVAAELTGQQVLELLDLVAGRADSDHFCQQSGLRFALRDGRAADVTVLRDPADPAAGYAAVAPEVSYRIATTDYMAYRVDGYRELFARARSAVKTETDAHAALIAALKAGPATAALDGRITRSIR